MVLMVSGQAIHHLIWHPRRHRLAFPIDTDIHYVDDNSGKNKASFLIFDGLFECQSQSRELGGLGGDAQNNSQPSCFSEINLRASDDKGMSARPAIQVLLLKDAKTAQIARACPLGKFQVVGMIDDTTEIGIFILTRNR
jgi:hypothetical protein